MNFIHCRTKENFEQCVANKTITADDLVFIDSSDQIWTHNKFYNAANNHYTKQEVDNKFKIIQFTSTDGIIPAEMSIMEGYVLVQRYGIKDGVVYPIVHIDQDRVVHFYTSKIISNTYLTYEQIENVDVTLIFIKI